MKAKPKKPPSQLEQDAYWAILAANLPEPKRQFYFTNERRWRFDFAWPELKIAFECEGGTWSSGGHVRGPIFEDNCAKYNHAQVLGWIVIRATTDMVKHSSGLVNLCDAFESRGYRHVNQTFKFLAEKEAAARHDALRSRQARKRRERALKSRR